LPSRDLGHAIEAAICKLRSSVEEPPKLFDIRLVLYRGGTRPKPIAPLPGNTMRRVVATRGSNDKDVVLPDRIELSTSPFITLMLSHPHGAFVCWTIPSP
jgi:hypothetical protein